MITRIHCGEPGRGPVDLIADWLAGRPGVARTEASDRVIAFTRFGREAIALAMSSWRVGPNDEVLVPAYNCGSEVSPILATGARVIMYRVDGHAQIDLDDLRGKLSSRTKAVCVVHYFGRMAEIAELAAHCRASGIRLIEDCALSLFSAGVGSLGDAAIFSLRKTLPVADGGILAIRPEGGEPLPARRGPSLLMSARGAASLLARWTGWRLAAPSAFIGAVEKSTRSSDPLPDIPPSYYYPSGKPVIGASRLARGIMNRVDTAHVVDQRRSNYEALWQGLEGVKGVDPLWAEPALRPGECPLGVPMLVDDKKLWVQRLNAAGIVVSPWWAGFHRGLAWGEFPDAVRLKQRLILLPVHQSLSAADMGYVAASVRRIAKVL
jgi:dTDP-4-amino-4,6-dideoxygalactose transaminase